MTDPAFLAVTAEIRMGLLMAAFGQASSTRFGIITCPLCSRGCFNFLTGIVY